MTILAALLFAGCAVAPPTSQRLVGHSVTDRSEGSLLIVDVCLNYSPMATGDYFVVGRARQGAAALEAAAAQFLEATDVRVKTKLIPFVCGALHDAASTPKRVAEDIDTEVSERPQPLWVDSELARDREYVDALQTLATHAFRRSVSSAATQAAPDAATTSTATAAAATAAPADPTEPERLRRAAALVAQRSGRSSLIYIGVTGHSLSTAKAATFGAARVIAGVALSLAIGPVFAVSGGLTTTSYYVVFVPGGPADKRQMAAGLWDLREGVLVNSRVVGGGGDPMKPDVLASREAVVLLLRDLVFQGASK
jgi:hypothetical protein